MNKKYSWNRNVSHHRIAMIRFAIVAFIQSIISGMITILGMGIKSDGSREYIVSTAVLGLVAMVVTYWAFFSIMSVMYRWILEVDVEKSPPPPLSKEWIYPYYEYKSGWKLGKPYQVPMGQGGQVDILHGKG